MPKNTDSSKAWPYWMLRYMMKDDEQAFEDLVWSVGGSPPYGGISYEEAKVVYHLIEDYRGKGMASPARYKAVRKFVTGSAAPAAGHSATGSRGSWCRHSSRSPRPRPL